ncbi:MAG: ABC transporter ATP-binding protein [Alphaproteobacteria bacterium]|nr:ABC transporter ATP-binding protein [Alphaproteobacteria bacterium]
MEPILSVDGLTVDYGRVRAVTDVTLRVGRGSIATMIGSNGAGKTTVLKAVVGLAKSRARSIRFDGEEIHGRETDRIVAAGIAVVPEGRRLFGSMTIRENLVLGAYLTKNAQQVQHSMEEVFAYFPVLGERLTTRASSLSGGQQQMLAVARALMSRPKLLILDEPSIGLAPVVVDKIVEIMNVVNGKGVSILLVEQNANMALEVAQEAYVLQDGAIVLKGPTAELARNDFVKTAYLGI